MEPVKHFDVLGMGIDILVSSASTNNSFTISAYDCPPSVGPPPHFHDKEDEIFSVVEGSFEIFNGKEWKDIPKGDYVHALRHKVHTFRNSGTTTGRLLCIATPGGLDEYLEAISAVSMPGDMPLLLETSNRFGITFSAPEPMPTSTN